MAGKQKTNNGYQKFKNDLKDGTIGQLYILYGQESYLREYYLKELERALVDATFREFNLLEYEGKDITPDALMDAVESYPAMAERKLVVIRDFPLYHAPSAFDGVLSELLADLPDYICLVFVYDTLEIKQDKRIKIHKVLDKSACFVEFKHLGEHELIAWIQRRVKTLGKTIDPQTCTYLIFLCGSSMTNLITEIDKAVSVSTVDEITRYHIDLVCSRVLDAVVFDLTDAITAHRFEDALRLLQDLSEQREEPVGIFTMILRHLQRMYAAKLLELNGGSERELMELIATRSSYYARKMAQSARKLSVGWLRQAVLLCAETDVRLKSTSVDPKEQIELALLTMASDFGETA